MGPLAKRVVEAVAPSLAYGYIRLLQATVRKEYRNREALLRAREGKGPYLFAFWHSRLVMVRFAYPDDRGVVLQSSHRDSRIAGRVMTRFGIGQVWGSTTRGGMKAAREVLRRIRTGDDIAVAPDGPRGPARRAQPGIIAIARLAGVPIVPVTYSSRRSLRMRSWDRMVLPLPFGRAVYVYGEPLRVDRGADDTEQERLRRQLEDELNRLTDLVDEEMGVPLVPPAEPADAENDR